MRFRIKPVLKSCEYVKDFQVPQIHDIYSLAVKITRLSKRHIIVRVMYCTHPENNLNITHKDFKAVASFLTSLP